MRQAGKWCNFSCITPCAHTSTTVNKRGTYTVKHNCCHNSSTNKQKHEALMHKPGGPPVLSFSALRSGQTSFTHDNLSYRFFNCIYVFAHPINIISTDHKLICPIQFQSCSVTSPLLRAYYTPKLRNNGGKTAPGFRNSKQEMRKTNVCLSRLYYCIHLSIFLWHTKLNQNIKLNLPSN